MSDEDVKKQVGLTNEQLAEISEHSTVDPLLLAEGLELIAQEKSAHFRYAFRHHWRAVLWSALLSMALVMDSFDGSLVSHLSGCALDHLLTTDSWVPCSVCPRSRSASATS